MMKYRFRGGGAGREAYERFAKWTPSKGFESKAGWTSASDDGGFLLLVVVDVATLLEFSAKFKDLNDELEITPAVELSERVQIALNAYAWSTLSPDFDSNPEDQLGGRDEALRPLD